MLYIFIVSVVLILSLKYAFSNFIKIKYKVKSSEIQEIKSEALDKPAWFLIVLFIAIYLVIMLEYNIIFIIITLLLVVGEFLYGLKKVKKMNENKYIIYYIGESVISFLLIILLIIKICFIFKWKIKTTANY